MSFLWKNSRNEFCLRQSTTYFHCTVCNQSFQVCLNYLVRRQNIKILVYPIIQKNNSCIATLLFKLLLICFHLHLMHHNLYSVKFSFHFLQFKVRYFFTKMSFSVYYSSTLEFSNNAISSWNFYDYLSMFILTAHIFWLLQPSLLTFSMPCSQCLFIFSHFSPNGHLAIYLHLTILLCTQTSHTDPTY